MTTGLWSRADISEITNRPIPTLAAIDASSVKPILPGYDLWDYWPIQERDGRTAEIAGGSLQMLLSAPALPDPDQRHAIARIRLMHQTSFEWRDLGNLLPDNFAPGSREWSGSAIISEAHDKVTLYFTSVGHRGETETNFDQHLFETTATLTLHNGVPKLGDWSPPVECVAADGVIYMRDMVGGGEIGTIKAFRDPAWFCDPLDGNEYLVFAASLAQSASHWNGAVGLARRHGDTWQLHDPLISADGVNNELERPHMVYHAARYYCFWSTQSKVFAKGGPAGPTGLYGMVAERLHGPWKPLNGTGLVFANPEAAPIQAYSWLVQHDLTVLSFVDRPELLSEPADPAISRSHFGGTPALPVRIKIENNYRVSL